MATATRDPLAATAYDTYYWYTPGGGPVEVQVNGTWHTAVLGIDPNGAVAWKLVLAGPEAQDPPLGAVVLRYELNRISARINGGPVVVDGAGAWDIWVITPGRWVSWLDPAVYNYITGRTGAVPSPPDYLVDLALQQAQEILGNLTGNLVHPAGTSTEDYRAVPVLHRLTPSVGPLVEVLSLDLLQWDLEPAAIVGYRIIGQSLYFKTARRTTDDGLWCDTWNEDQVLRITYRYGSTVTPAARQALLYFARQLWLAAIDSGECALPERVTSVTREGVTMSLLDPQTFLDKGRTGLPRIDLWIRTVNPAGSMRRSGIFTPDSPPGVRI